MQTNCYLLRANCISESNFVISYKQAGDCISHQIQMVFHRCIVYLIISAEFKIFIREAIKSHNRLNLGIQLKNCSYVYKIQHRTLTKFKFQQHFPNQPLKVHFKVVL